MDAIFNSNFGVMLWIRKKNIQDFLEAVWADAFVENDSCVKDGRDYTYHFNWTTNVLTIEPTNEKGECLIRITHNLVHYQHAFDLMKQELMSVISTNILPDYLKEEMNEEDYTFLTKMTHLCQTKEQVFTYFDNMNKVEGENTFNCPEFYYWDKYPKVYDMVYRMPQSSSIPNFMEDIYLRVCQRMEDNPVFDDLDTGCWEHTKECFYDIFPSGQFLDELMTFNKDKLLIHEEQVSFS